MDLARDQLHRAVTLLTQAALERISGNVLALAVALEDFDPVVGLRLAIDTPADRALFAETIAELDYAYHHDKAIPTAVAIAPAPLPARDWTYVYRRRDAG